MFMGDIEDGFFGKLVDWIVEVFLSIMMLLMALTGKGKDKK